MKALENLICVLLVASPIGAIFGGFVFGSSFALSCVAVFIVCASIALWFECDRHCKERNSNSWNK